MKVLIQSLLTPDRFDRITGQEILQHDFLKNRIIEINKFIRQEMKNLTSSVTYLCTLSDRFLETDRNVKSMASFGINYYLNLQMSSEENEDY